MSANARVQYGRRQESPLEAAIWAGVGAGVMALLVALVGIVVAFNNRFIITGVLSTGQALLGILALIAGYSAASRAEEPGESRLQLVAYGALAGLLVSGFLALLVLLGGVVNLREILVNASPQLYEVLLFGNELARGIPLLLTLGLLLGLFGAFIYLMPVRVRDAVILGLGVVLLFGLLQDLLALLLDRPGLEGLYGVLFARRGLNVVGALLLFALFFGGKMLWSSYGDDVERGLHGLPATTQRGVRWFFIALGILFLLFLPTIFGIFPTEVMNNVALLGILMGLGLNIVVGFAGLLDLGYVGFFAIGAYTMALLTSPEIGPAAVTFWQALPFSILVSVLFGVLLGIPVLNMRGDYLAIVTLGFGEIIRILVLSNALQPLVGGARGIVGIAIPSVVGEGLNTPGELYYLILIAVALTWFISTRLRDSRLGRAWMAIREDEDVAEAMGIHLITTKLLAFATGAAMAGLGGAIFAAKLQSIVPQTFSLLISVNALSIIIIGGLASIPGVVVGALLLIGLPELLREFNEYRLWLYGALLVVMMLYKPEGFWPAPVRKRELHDPGNPEMPEQATVPVPELEEDTLTDRDIAPEGGEERTLRI